MVTNSRSLSLSASLNLYIECDYLPPQRKKKKKEINDIKERCNQTPLKTTSENSLKRNELDINISLRHSTQ